MNEWATCKCQGCQDHRAQVPGREIGRIYVDALVYADHHSLIFITARAYGELDECSRRVDIHEKTQIPDESPSLRGT